MTDAVDMADKAPIGIISTGWWVELRLRLRGKEMVK